MITQQITGKLDPKRVVRYLQATHKQNALYVQRCHEDEGAFFVSDKFILLKAPLHPLLSLYLAIKPEWERATFEKGVIVSQEGGADCAILWKHEGQIEMKPLELTCELLEVVGQRGKHGKRSRKFLFEGETNIYIDDRLTDIFSPDLDELDGFLFETSGRNQIVRVSAHNGIVAYVMPLYTKDR